MTGDTCPSIERHCCGVITQVAGIICLYLYISKFLINRVCNLYVRSWNEIHLSKRMCDEVATALKPRGLIKHVKHEYFMRR